MFSKNDVENALETACDELHKLTPGTEEYVRQAEAIRHLTAALRTLVIMEE